jgi:DNA-binding IclR family transcriptional regulator
MNNDNSPQSAGALPKYANTSALTSTRCATMVAIFHNYVYATCPIQGVQMGRGRKPKSFVVNQPIPSIQKALAILELFCSTRRGYTITEIAKIFKIPVSTSSSLLYTLVSCGYLKRSDTGTFTLTMKLLGQAHRGLSQLELNDIAQPELERMTSITGLASALFIREIDSVVCVAKVEGSSHIRTAAHVGKQMPMHATCTGKALLACLPSGEAEQLLKRTQLTRLTDNTITSLPLLIKELAKIRAHGYAADDQEYGVGVQGISAPVFDSRGKAVGAISASGAVFEVENNLSTIIAAVRAASSEVSRSLGYSDSVVTSAYRQEFARKRRR